MLDNVKIAPQIEVPLYRGKLCSTKIQISSSVDILGKSYRIRPQNIFINFEIKAAQFRVEVDAKLKIRQVKNYWIDKSFLMCGYFAVLTLAVTSSNMCKPLTTTG